LLGQNEKRVSKKDAIELSSRAAQELYLRRRMRRHFYPFFLRVFSTLNPKTKLNDNWHIKYLCEILEAAYYGLGPRKLIINIPPRFLKSTICTVAFPAWVLGKNAAHRVLACSYSSKLSIKHSVDCRLVMESQWYKNTFPETRIAPDQNEKAKYQTTKRGHRIATSVGGSATGEGGDILIADDPMNPEEAMSDTMRQNTNDWMGNTWSSRMDVQDGIDLIIMQRLHDEDTTGWAIQSDPDYTLIRIPQEAEEREQIVLPISKEVIIREPGDLLHPERFDREYINKQKIRLGSYMYAAQHQQDPVPAGGGMFKEEWWQFYECLPDVYDEMIQSWDMTFRKTEDGSYVTGQIWLRKGANKFLVDQIRARMDFPETIKAVIRMTSKYPDAMRKLIEDKANGPAVIDTLRHKIPGIVPVSPDGSKEARAASYAAQVEAGNIYLPHPDAYPEKATMVADFIHEHSRCPKGKYWDQIDAASQAVRHMSSATMSSMYGEDDSIFADEPAVFASGGSPWA